MKSSLLSVGLAALMGCATAPRVTVYPNIQKDLIVVETDQVTVNDVCRRGQDGKPHIRPQWDDGREIQPYQNIGGCFVPWTNTIWILKDAPSCLWRHELGHSAGWTAEAADSVKCE